jgi:GNAT superfamily N-acetyltransferase
LVDLLGADCGYRGSAEKIANQLGGMTTGLFAKLVDDAIAMAVLDPTTKTLSGIALFGVDATHNTCRMSVMAIDPKEHRLQIGTSLLEAVEGWASDQKCAAIELVPETVNDGTEPDPGVLSFFDKHGFQLVGTGTDQKLVKPLQP